MIKTLSPYYVTIPWLTAISYTLKIYVWDGLKSAVPTTASYSITKINQTNSNGTDKINIARLLNDFIDFTPNESNQRWCKVTVTYTSYLGVGDEQDLFIDLILKGYGYGMSGENPQPPANRILLQGNEFKVNRDGVFNFPILILEA